MFSFLRDLNIFKAKCQVSHPVTGAIRPYFQWCAGTGCIASQEPVIIFSFQVHVQWRHVSCLKSAIVGVLLHGNRQILQSRVFSPRESAVKHLPTHLCLFSSSSFKHELSVIVLKHCVGLLEYKDESDPLSAHEELTCKVSRYLCS